MRNGHLRPRESPPSLESHHQSPSKAFEKGALGVRACGRLDYGYGLDGPLVRLKFPFDAFVETVIPGARGIATEDVLRRRSYMRVFRLPRGKLLLVGRLPL